MERKTPPRIFRNFDDFLRTYLPRDYEERIISRMGPEELEEYHVKKALEKLNEAFAKAFR